jgi:hypothetical protein
MAVGVVLLFLYWTAAIHGVVPSPGRPLVSGHSATNTFTNHTTFHAAGEPPPPKQSAPANPPENAPAANPEYVTFTAAHASRFAKFGIALHKQGELARLAAPLPAYFSGAEYALEFVPDHSLARIMAESLS